MGRKLFGTDGIRGKANVYPMTGEMAHALGRAVTHYFQKSMKNPRPVIIIGKDTRLSCYMLEQAMSAGVCSQGGEAILTGPLPTPGVAFVTQSMRADAGVMISASHNHYSDNGIKIFDARGFKLPDDVELELEEMILNPNRMPLKTDNQLGRARRLDEVNGRYIVHVKSAVARDYSLEGMRLVVDSANGAAYKTAPMVFSELGAEVFSIGNIPNGTNINEGVGSLYPDVCAKQVQALRADLGVCLDGDADRVVIVDKQGRVVDGDKLLGLLARYLKDSGELGNNLEIVGTVMTNIGLEHYLSNHGLQLIRTKVGDRYIFDYMKRSGAIFGGEPSGHLIFRSHATTGDGILSALKVIEAMKFYQKDLETLIDEVKLFPQILKNVTVKSKPDFETIPSIEKVLKKVRSELGSDGRVLLRYSGTESKARVMMEGPDQQVLEELCQEMVEVVQKEIG